MASLGQEMKNLRSELQEHRVNTVEGNPRTVDPNQKRRQDATRFCNYCRTNGHTPEAKIFEKETRISLKIDLGEIPLLLNRIFLQDQTSHMGTTIRTMEDHMINARTSQLIVNRNGGNRSRNESFINQNGNWRSNGRLSRSPSIQRGTFRKIIHTAIQEVINPTILPSADFTIDLRLVLRPTNKSSRKTIIRHLMWFASPQPTEPLTKYQTSVR